MKKLFQLILLITVSGALMTSCYYDTEYEYVDMENEDVSYSMDIMPLWNADCVGCHSGTEPPDMRDNVSYEELLNGYVVPGNAANSVLYKSLLGIDLSLIHI